MGMRRDHHVGRLRRRVQCRANGGLVAAHRVTHLTVPPPVFDALANDPRIDEHDVSSLLLVVTGGAHTAADVERRASERLGCVARQGYQTTT